MMKKIVILDKSKFLRWLVLYIRRVLEHNRSQGVESVWMNDRLRGGSIVFCSREAIGC